MRIESLTLFCFILSGVFFTFSDRLNSCILGSAGSKVKPGTVGTERGQKTYNCDIIGTLRFNCEGFFTVSFVFPQKFVKHGVLNDPL